MTSAVERFRELLRIPTVSSLDSTRVDVAAFERFTATLTTLYPLMHAELDREVVGEGSLLYRWRGARSDDPLVLMAHMDVVPVAAGEWQHPPFAAELVGEGANATIHARGAIDDKGALVAIAEAVEGLLADGVVPPRDVYLVFGHDEETSGSGARAIAALLESRGVRPALVLDEGGAVVSGVLPGVDVPTAMIGVAERGILALGLSVTERGGHASTPPAIPATARLARAIDRLRRRPFPQRLAPPVRAMLATAAPHAPAPLRAVLQRLDVLGPLVARVLSRLGPEMNAVVRSTAVVTELSGSAAQNVLATRPRATVDIRLLTGDTVAGAVEHVRRAIADPQVEIEVLRASEPSPVSPWRGPAWQRVAATVRETLGDDVVPLPYVQLGASDSRWFTGIADAVYRFAPFALSSEERAALHSHDERIGVQTWLRGIEFYRALIIRP
ncbi:M20/M25/M40 family metallo-hydrolase [Microbacterium sp. P04]|uniref:M20/M25/M40 family metallo-hydrolase n=1 Tax=Microbacterium sp. P04 TaxID=3366947 RepID=UPI00374524B6